MVKKHMFDGFLNPFAKLYHTTRCGYTSYIDHIVFDKDKTTCLACINKLSKTISGCYKNKKYQNYFDDEFRFHREDGPAEISKDMKRWFSHGQLHRLDGPAVEFSDNSKYWWYYNKHIVCQTQQEFERLIRLRMFW